MPHELRVALWLALALFLFLAVAKYVRGHLRAALRFPPRGERLYAYWLAAVVMCAITPRFAPAFLGPLSPWLGQFAAVSLIGLVVTSVLLVPYDALRLTYRGLFRRQATADRATALAQPAPDTSVAERRDVLRSGVVLAAAGCGFGGSLYGTMVGRREYKLEQVPLKLAKLPRRLDGFTLVQLSDIHMGQFLDDAQLAEGVRLIKQAKPDAIVLTGDLIDHDVRYSERLFRFVHSLTGLARHGVFAVPGNHDHYAGVFAIERGLREAGADVLTNRHVLLGQGADAFVLAGLDDVMGEWLNGRGPDLKAAFRGAPPDALRVLLSHNPSYFPTSRTSADLTLSGHTHGGQIALFINPAELVLPHGYVRGLYTRDDSLLYVNRGFGTAGPPIRIGSFPEVTQLILTV